MNIYSSLFQHKGLSLERLQSFCLVAEAKGFNKAAGENTYKQSQFSRQISDLEKFLGTPLFIRKGKSIELTPQGKELYALCKDFFHGMYNLKNATNKHKKSLIIAAGQSVIDFLMPQAFNVGLIEQLAKVSFISSRSDEGIEHVLNYHAHCAFISKVIRNKDLTSIPVLSSPTVMIYAKNHAGKFYTGNEISMLAKNPIAIMEGSSNFSKSVIKLFGRYQPNILFEASTFMAIKRIAAAGNAMAFIPQYILTEEDKNTFDEFPIPKKTSLPRSIHLVYRKNLGNQNKAILKIIQQLAHNIQFNIPSGTKK